MLTTKHSRKLDDELVKETRITVLNLFRKFQSQTRRNNNLEYCFVRKKHVEERKSVWRDEVLSYASSKHANNIYILKLTGNRYISLDSGSDKKIYILHCPIFVFLQTGARK